MFTKEKLEELIKLDGGVCDLNYHTWGKIGAGYSNPSVQEQLAIESKHGISCWGYKLLEAFAGTSNYNLNSTLRSNSNYPKNEFYEKFECYLNEVLDEIPPFEHKVVYRWTYHTDDVVNFLKRYLGKLIMRPDFTSGSKFKNSSYKYFYEIKTCKNSNCRDIETIVNKEKGHVLFKSKTVFKINSFREDTFYLDEVKSNDWDLELVHGFWKL